MCSFCGWEQAFATTRHDFHAASADIAPDVPNTVIFINGAVYTMNPKQPWVEAVVVEGSRIAYVGDNSGAKAFRNANSKIVDLKGKFLMPGFVEGHTHPIMGSYITQGVDLQYDTREATIAALEEYAKQTQGQQTIRGFGWRYIAFPATGPRKEDLDRIWPETPVQLFAIDGHCSWVNSAALEFAGITKQTPDPMPGFSYYERDPATGEPTGYLVEVTAELSVLNALEPPTDAIVARCLEAWLPKASAAGITTLCDAGIVIVPQEVGYNIYRELEAAGKLPLRVIGSSFFTGQQSDPIADLMTLRSNYRSELVQVQTLKIVADGGDAQYTAAMIAPYNDKPETRGETGIPLETLVSVIADADRAGLDVHVHSYGDRTTRLCLDAIEAAIAANPIRDRRHTLAHQIYVDDADIPRFNKLGVIGQYSTQWAVPDPPWERITKARWGARAEKLYRVRSLLATAGRVSLGTDWPAAGYYSTYKPLDAIEVATTRQALGKPDSAVLPPSDERISVAQALEANTLGAAYQLRLERQVGSLEPGKFADMIVLEENLLRVPPHAIHTVPVTMTIMNGRFKHGA